MSKTNEEYWEARLLKREDANFIKTQKFADEMTKIYHRQIDEINKEIDSYLTYQSNQIDMLEVDKNLYDVYSKTLLEPIDLEEYNERISVLINKWAILPEGTPKKAELMAQMRVLRTQQNLTLLQAMKGSIRMHLMDYSMELITKTEEMLVDNYTDILLYTQYENACRTSVFTVFAMPNKEAIKEFVRTPISGLDFAETIWKTTNENFTNDLTRSLQDIIVRGKGVNAVKKQMKNVLKPTHTTMTKAGSLKTTRYGDYAIRRILQTESSRTFNQGRINAMKERGHTHYKVLAVSDSKRCEKCNNMHGKEYPIDDMRLPAHPNCRCSAVTVNSYDGQEYWHEPAETINATKGYLYQYKGQLYTVDDYNKIKKDIPNKREVKRVYAEDLNKQKTPSFKKWKEEYVQ